ncbi:MAG: hypothetical protein Q7K57_11870 [Burkholderiaceae bacterium]|nr:hypothetical protein [Burkholderiaceae bacterium]
MRELFVRTIGVLTVGIVFLIPGVVTIYLASPLIVFIFRNPLSSWSLNSLLYIWEVVIFHPAAWKLCLLSFSAGIAWGLFAQISMYLRDRRNK